MLVLVLVLVLVVDVEVVDVEVLDGEIVVVVIGAVVVESSMAAVRVPDSEPAADCPEQLVISSMPPTRTAIGCQRTSSR